MCALGQAHLPLASSPSPLTSTTSLPPSASLTLDMITVTWKHGQEAGDGPEAGGDASAVPRRGHGGVCGHHLLHPGHNPAAPPPEKVLSGPGL